MKRSWLIGAALVLSLSAVACSDDDDGPATVPVPDSGTKDGGGPVTGGGLDGGSNLDAGHDAGHTADAGDAG